MMRQSVLVLALIVGASGALLTAQGRGLGPGKAPSAKVEGSYMAAGL